MAEPDLEKMKELTQARTEVYLHLAKTIVMNEFGPATEHTHTDVSIALASAMMQHESAQMIAEAIRS